MWLLSSILACMAPEPPELSPSETPLPCGGGTDLHLAPPPFAGPDGPIAAVDVIAVDVLAVPSETEITFEATMTFLVGELEGQAAFEFHPDAVVVELDGSPSALEVVSVSHPAREVVVLSEPLGACTEHTVRLEYSVSPGWKGDVGRQERYDTRPGGIYWAAGLEDAAVGQFLGMWAPSNLLFDRFDLSLSIDDSALPAPHTLMSTGEPFDVASGWGVQWRRIQAHAPFWVLTPEGLTESAQRTVMLSGGPIELDVRQLTDGSGADMQEVLDRAELALEQFDRDYGAYGHGDRYRIFVRDDQSSAMEYDGATITTVGAIEHEIMHSWFGRGAAPVADRHGWLDEAMTSWVTEFYEISMDVELSGEGNDMLLGDDDWAGAALDLRPYLLGGIIFASLADRHGPEAVRAALRAFYLEFHEGTYTSEQAEAFLTCHLDDDYVRELFAHHAYGDSAPLEPRPGTWCD